jgi:hypothetical protein
MLGNTGDIERRAREWGVKDGVKIRGDQTNRPPITGNMVSDEAISLPKTLIGSVKEAVVKKSGYRTHISIGPMPARV